MFFEEYAKYESEVHNQGMRDGMILPLKNSGIISCVFSYYHPQNFLPLTIEVTYKNPDETTRTKVDSGAIVEMLIRDIMKIWPDVGLHKVVASNHNGDNIITKDVLEHFESNTQSGTQVEQVGFQKDAAEDLPNEDGQL